TYTSRNLSKTSLREAQAVLRNFGDFCGNIGTKGLTQRHFDRYIESRIDGLSPATVNKEIRYLSAFVRWASHRKRRYLDGDIEFTKLKFRPKPVKALTVTQVRRILKACPHDEWRVRVLLSLCTGLRASDIDRLRR
ncbi:MAG: phage integrase N-terminal SAM-like domain-containing protein, partial [Desulfurococcales archaeon]|nr:phage integrase N-terminal SAM-like domain-containing protein [Desulfurococcales archaeon]